VTPEDERFHRARFARLDERSRARARSYGRVWSRVDLLAVFDKAGWMCGLCGDRIDASLRWEPPPRWVGPTVDKRTAAGRRAWARACRDHADARAAVAGNNAGMPSVDHVVPLWCGGTHEEVNCRPAHYGCNGQDGGGWPPTAEAVRAWREQAGTSQFAQAALARLSVVEALHAERGQRPPPWLLPTVPSPDDQPAGPAGPTTVVPRSGAVAVLTGPSEVRSNTGRATAECPGDR
jgi:hypothetical protein